MPSHKRGILQGKCLKPSIKRWNSRGTKVVNIKVTLAPRDGETRSHVGQLFNHGQSNALYKTPHEEPMDAISEGANLELNTVITKHFKRQQQVSSKWSALREPMMHQLISASYPSTFQCSVCLDFCPEIIRCSNCGPNSYFCKDCCNERHQTSLHSMERWDEETKTFLPYTLYTTWTRPDGHTCGTTHIASVVVIDDRGHQNLQNVQLCKCEERAVTLVSYGLWPASPSIPTVAFTLDLMLTLRALVLEGQVSLTSFCQGLQECRNLFGIGDWVTDISRLLRWETVLNFMEIYSSISTLQFCSDMPNGTKCLACPQEGSNKGRIISVDGNFRLVHRKAAGYSVRDMLHRDKYFLNQHHVDEFVDNYSVTSNSRNGTCSNFQADSIIRAKNKTEKLDVTGVFGAVCSHDHPVKFLNMRHGERMSYPLVLISSIDNIDILMYDIGCQLEGHLLKQGIQYDYKIAVPIFHVYGHQMSCQVKYNPRCIKGAGLCDGEGTERLWSYLGRFAHISKEMTPENRMDLLTEAIMFYGLRITWKMSNKLCQRLGKGLMLKESTGNDLQELTKIYQGTTFEQIENWSVQEISQWKVPKVQEGNGWEEEYVLILAEFWKKRESMAKMDEDDLNYTTVLGELERSEAKLLRIERKHKITRWREDEPQYINHLVSACNKKRRERLQEIRDCVVECNFMERLQKKYAKGQSLANRIINQLRAANRKLHKALTNFNDLPKVGTLPIPFKLEKKDVIALDSTIWENLCPNVPYATQVPTTARRQLLDTYRLNLRAKEDIELTKESMENFLMSLQKQISRIDENILLLSELEQTHLIKSKCSLLRKHLAASKTALSTDMNLFSSSTLCSDTSIKDFIDALENKLTLRTCPKTAENVPKETVENVFQDIETIEEEFDYGNTTDECDVDPYDQW